MALTQFENQPKDELSLVEIATALLEQEGSALPFSTLVEEMRSFLSVSEKEFESRTVQFYTDLNVDGSFISLGNNIWGLREWYPVDAIDENIHDEEDEEVAPKPKKKAKKVNVFADSLDDDVIDYNEDDPEDEDFEDVDTSDEDDSDSEESEDDDVDETIDDHLNELSGGNDLDDLSDGDQE